MKKHNQEAIKTSDHGPKEREQHNGGITIEAAEKTPKGDIIHTRARAKDSSSLHWYLKKGSITQQMYEAGLIFALWFQRAGHTSHIKSCLDTPIKIDKSLNYKENHASSNEDARRHIIKVCKILSSLERNVIIDVAGFEKRAQGSKRTLALKTGLRALATYYRLPIKL